MPDTPDNWCPTCGSPVEVVSSDEGTSHYVPLSSSLGRTPMGSQHLTASGSAMRSPTMPDTLTPEQIAAIRADNETGDTEHESCERTVERLLAHIDSLTAAVEALPRYGIVPSRHGTGIVPDGSLLDRESVLVILRGEQTPRTLQSRLDAERAILPEEPHDA
jgi:hypothetical protein